MITKRRYRKVSVEIWNDPDFMSWSNDGKLAFLFLLTHPHMLSIGCMRATIPGLAAEIGWTEKGLREGLREPYRKGSVKASESASFLWIPNFLKHNPPENPNVVKSWENIIDLIPKCELQQEMFQDIVNFIDLMPKGYGISLPEPFRKGYAIPTRKGMPIPDPDPDPDPDPETTFARTKKAAKSPAMKINFNFDSKAFVNITDADKEAWKAAYPACNIEIELNRMAAWLIANPDKRKIRYGRFIVNWLSRSQDKGGSNGQLRENRVGNLVKGQGGAAFYRNPDAKATYARREAESKANAKRLAAEWDGSGMEESPDFGSGGNGGGGQVKPIPDPAPRQIG